MSKKQWLVLLMLFLTYLLLGASIFYHIESRLEIDKIAQAKLERIDINALLHEHYVPSTNHNQSEILEKLTQYCGKSVYNYTEGEVDRHQWDFYNSFYFAYTVVSTIGYGNLAPTNTLSRILMIFYGLVGIPMNGILLTQLGEFFSYAFVKAHRKYKSYKHGQSEYSLKKPMLFETRKVGLAAQIFMYLMPGFVMFIFFPAFLFSHYEGWTYDQSVYYAFVTLTTIGFGDLVAGQDNTKGSGPSFIAYKVFLIFWISFGLGYIVMIMTFIARGMRSKKITRLEHKLAMNLKHTQSKIWNEFNKEVNYLRRVFNELQLSKVKRVYVDECDYEVPTAKLSRSNSFPDLRNLTIGGYADNFTPHPRRRANSEVVPTEQLTRVVSETDLQRIDKTATFAAHAMVQPAELLARLVNVLGYIPPRDDLDWENEDQTKQADVQNDIQSKPIDQGLANNVSQWKIGGEKFPFAKPRSRAASEVRLQTTKDDYAQQNAEWTWSGPVASKKLQELMKARDTTLPSKDKPYRKFPSLALPITAPKNFFPRWRRQSSKRMSEVVSPIAKNMEKVVMDDSERSNQQNNSIGGPIGPPPSYSLDERHDSMSKRPHYYTHTGANLSTYLEGNNLLEETSLADFLRALTALHARVGTVPDDYIAKPKRKLGTACLSPPKLPSLFTLFSGPNGPGSGSATQSNQNTVTDAQSYQSSRRVSLKTPESNYSGSTTPMPYIRRESVAVKPRRFSLRPVMTPVSPSTPSDYGSPRPSVRDVLNDRNLRESSYVSMEPFISVSPKEPLVNMEGPPGISLPIKPSGSRRFSIRPAQLSAQVSPTSTKSTPTPLQTPKLLPRWKAGMLQRQISQMNLRRRARAFSLSDVHSDRREKTAAPLSPLAMDNNVKFVDKTNQKTVTIVSPAEEMTAKNELQNFAVNPASLRYEPASPSFVPIYEPVYKPTSPEGKLTFEQKLINLNDVNRPVQRATQETNVDVTEASFKIEKSESDTHTCVIDNLDESPEAKSSTTSGSSLGLRRGKPSVPIDPYKTPLQATIEKPAINPFEQYRAMTRSGQKEDADLKEVKVEKPREKREA
ncbi:Open rectifier potassium channel protein [Ooceraea biroi]|uniref:Open rectifier potassium channel protein n=1 Tax=Ooceraea biroi TaxID=2015173 RepID=A0A026X3P1_OOCBI|nr:Open rectifier potassium channel protein [Ooceraea biroi]